MGAQAPSSCAAPSFPGYWVRSGGTGHWQLRVICTVCAFKFHHCPGASSPLPRILSLEPPLASAMYEVLCLQVLANLFAKFQPQTI